jgi:hypothetical protein
MEPKLPVDRRALLALAGGGLAAALAPEGVAAAQIGQGTPIVHGQWMNLANNAMCGIFQAGAVLILVNENGDMATGQLQGRRLHVMRGWNVNNLTGLVTGNAQNLHFSNGSQWQKV